MLDFRDTSFLNTVKNLKVLIFLAISAGIFLSCGTSSLNVEAGWKRVGLEDTKITVLENDRDKLLIGTSQGLFKWDGTELINLGLNDQEIRGVVRLKDLSLLVGVVKASGYSSGDTTLFRSTNEGKSWDTYLNNFGGNVRYTAILSGPNAVNPPSDTIFVNRYGAIARSVDGGKHWELITGEWDSLGMGLAVLFYIDPYHPERLWHGGVTGISQAYLWKSLNFEKNDWINVSNGLSDNVEAVAYDIITHPTDADLILVGLSGAITAAKKIKKSTDGGITWTTTFSQAGIMSLTHSAHDLEVIYASGENTDGTLFFVVSRDFGDSWETIVWEDGPAGMQVNDMVSRMEEGREVLYLGTNNGVYSYRFEE